MTKQDVASLFYDLIIVTGICLVALLFGTIIGSILYHLMAAVLTMLFE